jgi:SAM-dependent methyltransferase
MTGIQHELDFWKKFVQTPRFLEGWCSSEKTPELREPTYSFIKDHLPAKVLDCGSGVVSLLTGTVPNEDLTVCDLLGDKYAEFFEYEKYNVVKPLGLSCEELLFDEEFDIVHISNALDHTQHPVVAVHKLTRAVKPGGYLIIQGFENEGLYENWEGLHQWNLSIDGDSLAISSIKGVIYTVTSSTVIVDRTFLPTLNKYWITFIAQK